MSFRRFLFFVDVNRAQRYGSNNQANEFLGGMGGI